MKTRTAPRPQPAAPFLALVAVSIAGAMLAMMLISRYVWGVDLPTFFTSVREYNEAQATAQIVGPQDAPVAAPAPRYGAGEAAPVSQPAEPATAPLVKPAPKGKAEPTPEPKATPGGKDAQAAPLEVAAAEVVKPTPGGKTTKVREGKGTP